MILPFLDGIPKFLLAPVTWVLVLMNLIAYVYFHPNQAITRSSTERYLENKDLMSAQGRIYSDFVLSQSGKYSGYLVDVAALANLGRKEKIELMGYLALRDNFFIKKSRIEDYSGDVVEYAYWRKHIDEYSEVQELSPGSLFGMISSKSEIYRWISYQFIHGSFLHIFSNMWFLIIFGGFLEKRIGSLRFLGAYLLSGVVAAIAVNYMSGFTGRPLVGASGSIMGLVGIFASFSLTYPHRFLFWIFPKRGFWGFIFLPAWVSIGILFLLDIAGYLGTVAEFGAVAHSAHIGGVLIGYAIGTLFLKKYRLSTLPTENRAPQVQTI